MRKMGRVRRCGEMVQRVGRLDIVLLTYYQNHNQFIAFQQWPKIRKKSSHKIDNLHNS